MIWRLYKYLNIILDFGYWTTLTLSSSFIPVFVKTRIVIFLLTINWIKIVCI